MKESGSEAEIVEARKQEALSEVARAKENKGPGLWKWPDFFNNFYTKISSEGFKRSGLSESSLDKKFDKPDEILSSLRNSQTLREFMASIQEEIKNEGIDQKRIDDLIKKSKTSFTPAFTELYELLIPVYVRLRMRGYNRHDIIR